LEPDASVDARAAAMGKLSCALADVNAHLEGRDSVLDAFSVIDVYLLAFCLWRAAPALGGALPAFPNLNRFQQAMLGRPGLMEIVAGDMKIRSEP
jgi:glutathione S-transferase